MAKIKNTRIYPRDLEISGEELLVGSDTDERGKTKNYRIRDIARYVFEGRVIEGIDQNNISRIVDVGELNPEGGNRSVSDAVNALVEFEVYEDEIFYFSCFTERRTEPSLGFSQEVHERVLVNYLYLFRKGKGIYGRAINNETTPVSESDFILLNKEEIRLPSIFDKQPVVYHVSNPSGLSAVDAINNSGRLYDALGDSDVYFQVSNVLGKTSNSVYRFVGPSGTYGDGGDLMQNSYILTLNEAGIRTECTKNIRIVEFNINVLPGQTKADAINNLDEFKITQDELALFRFKKSLPGGRVEISSWFSKRGAGRYNVSGAIFQTRRWEDSDLVLNEKEILYLTGTESKGENPQVQHVYIPDDNSKSVIESINDSDTPVIVNSNSYISVIEKNYLFFQFVGPDGIYGRGYESCSEEDLKELVPFDKHNEDIDINDLYYGTNKWQGSNSFGGYTEIKELTFTGHTVLPQNANENTLISFNGQLIVFLNGQWNVLSLKPLMS